MKYSYDFPKASNTVDAVIFGVTPEGGVAVLLIERKSDPHAGCWALPGGFIELHESLETSARRELREETGLDVDGPLFQVGTWGDPGRDPRGRNISTVFVGLVHTAEASVKGADDASAARFWPADELPKLAFDHERIIPAAREMARRAARFSGFKGFSDSELALL